ncbi:hypothetical protein EYR38_006153 [Pleurotus pulmonarius]|nr:hypothetical protein EYR38_006153 [Pleurotus pulmonarius]
MDDHFSWSDTAYAAFGSCLACFHARQSPRSNETLSNADNHPHNHIVRSIRSDELEGLLVDSGDDAETLSLHSNPGRSQRRKKSKTRTPRNITLFGWNLFGKRKPPIQLPDDGEEGIDGIIRPSRLSSRGTSGSTSTLDSDAPQLSPTLIDSISPEVLRDRALAAEAAEAEERRQKEERRQRRREKRELKRAALALAAGGDGDFEGFQGSGADYFHSHSPTSPSLPDSASDGFGPFVGSTHALRPGPSHPDQDDGDETADLDGGVYTRKAVAGSLSGSDSRSRTSASRSDVSHHIYQPINQPPMPHPRPQLHLRPQDRPAIDLTPSSSDSVPRKKRSKKSKSSTTSGSQTPSIRSPASPTSLTVIQRLRLRLLGFGMMAWSQIIYEWNLKTFALVFPAVDSTLGVEKQIQRWVLS